SVFGEWLSLSYGVRLRQLSLFSVSRNDPLNALPPDLVTTFTTPPWKRPNSAETPDVMTLVSWIASSMYRLFALPRMLSFATTPLIMKLFSYDIDPATEYWPPGPVGATDGARSIDALMSRFVGSVAISSCLKLLATCAVCVSTSPARPTTLTVSTRPPTAMVT